VPAVGGVVEVFAQHSDGAGGVCPMSGEPVPAVDPKLDGVVPTSVSFATKRDGVTPAELRTAFERAMRSGKFTDAARVFGKFTITEEQ